MSFQFDIETDKVGILAQVRADTESALPLLSQQILQDCNYFCKQDQEGLINSSLTASDPDKGELVWDTPYAARQYYLVTACTDKNPNASFMWCHKAQEAHSEDWKKLLQKLFGGDGK